MKSILVTGGTVFVSKYIAEYYVAKGWKVYVLNRNTREQVKGVNLIEADRHYLGEKLKEFHFDVVIDNAYTGEDVRLLLDAIGSYEEYILISSSAVYPEYAEQPFKEGTTLGINKYWGKYGTDKIEAEKILQERSPNAYIIRPPYLYGPMNNVYREAFVFECALAERKFYLPREGEMKLQFFHVRDLCNFMDDLLENKPMQRIYNVGNEEAVSIRKWVEICYEIVGKKVDFVEVFENIEQRNYFSFYDYEYMLDVSAQKKLMKKTISLKEGLLESFQWYMNEAENVVKKPYIEYIDTSVKSLFHTSN